MQAVVQSAKNTGRLKQCAMRQNFPARMPFEDMVKTAAQIGLWGFDLASPTDWPVLKKYGMSPSSCTGGGMNFNDGIIRTELHDNIVKQLGTLIDQCAEGGCPNIIGIGGQRKGMPVEQAADNAVAFYNKIKAHLEDKNVTLVTEVVNTRNDDPNLGRTDQIMNHMAYAADIMKRVNSPRVKILCDIYHMQIMDGDIVRNIRDYYQYIGHFHTGGVPGRHELDNTQEINYRYVAQAIADLGYQGYVAHEFRPAVEANYEKNLKDSVEIMRV
jgi:hydroxypyruvate isomerase